MAPPPVAEGLEQEAVLESPQLAPEGHMLDEGRETEAGSGSWEN